MATKDYSGDSDYYSQGFEKAGVVSIWLGLRGDEGDTNVDVLQDLCGVGYYRLDDQESNCFDFESVEVERLLRDLSYSASFMPVAVAAARERGISHARWAVVQYDFEYDSNRVGRPIADDPVFLGSFSYSTE